MMVFLLVSLGDRNRGHLKTRHTHMPVGKSGNSALLVVAASRIHTIVHWQSLDLDPFVHKCTTFGRGQVKCHALVVPSHLPGSEV